MSLREHWDDSAEDWIRWARSPGHDHYFWRLNLPALLELLPPPGRRTLDVGCGEGRLARELSARGHRVTGVEGSPALAEAARASDPALEVICADAAELPLPDASADLAVACLSLLNMDDMPRVVAEVVRVLEPGGRFAIVEVHPFRSAAEVDDYFAATRFTETRERDGLRMTFHDTHRPLTDLFGALEGARMTVEAVREPVPDDAHVAERPEAARWRKSPLFLHLRAIKPVW
jgi:SAM-dependent methyltransferase